MPKLTSIQLFCCMLVSALACLLSCSREPPKINATHQLNQLGYNLLMRLNADQTISIPELAKELSPDNAAVVMAEHAFDIRKGQLIVLFEYLEKEDLKLRTPLILDIYVPPNSERVQFLILFSNLTVRDHRCTPVEFRELLTIKDPKIVRKRLNTIVR